MFREVPLNIIQDVSFDAEATLAMGSAFDHACHSLRKFGSAGAVREIIAKQIIEAAKNGECDPGRLYKQALIPFGIEDMSIPVISRSSDPSAYQPVLLTEELLQKDLELLRHGGGEAISLFMEMSERLYEAGAEPALQSWITIAAPALPEAERGEVLALVLNAFFNRGCNHREQRSLLDAAKPAKIILH
jgi:hypothetical protein